MIINTNRRKRRRRPTLTPRFGNSTVALEIGLLRMTLGVEREIEHSQKPLDEKKVVKIS